MYLFINKGDVRVGFGTKDQKELAPGSYSAEDIDIEGKYAVIATSGEGTFQIIDHDNNEKQYVTLDEFLYNDINKRAPQVVNQILYEEGEKVEINRVDKLIVKGDSPFKIRLIKR